MSLPTKTKNGILTLRISLRKSWARKATYFIDINKVSRQLPQKTLTDWSVTKSWKFTRRTPQNSSEVVEGSIPTGYNHPDLLTAMSVAETYTDLLLERDYIVENVDCFIDPSTMPDTEFELANTQIRRLTEKWSEKTVQKTTVVASRDKISVTLQETKSAFQLAREKRAKKASWS